MERCCWNRLHQAMEQSQPVLVPYSETLTRAIRLISRKALSKTVAGCRLQWPGSGNLDQIMWLRCVEVSTSKTGKHGHAKAHIVAIDIFTGAGTKG